MNIALVYADRLEFDELYPIRDKRLEQLETSLKRHGLDVTRIDRKHLPDSLESFDLVIAAGGDGTQLDAAVRLQTKPLCAVRLFPEKSVGFHCTLDYNRFDDFITALRSHSLRTVVVPRIQAFIDGSPVAKPVLNDILVAHPCPARASRYAIQWNDISETQCSSGIWIATQPGSHGAAHSAGATPLDESRSDTAVFQVRELASQSATIKSGCFLPDRDIFKIQCIGTPLMLWFDGGLQSVPFSKGQTLTVSYRKHPLTKWTL